MVRSSSGKPERGSRRGMLSMPLEEEAGKFVRIPDSLPVVRCPRCLATKEKKNLLQGRIIMVGAPAACDPWNVARRVN